jgi:predicted phosphodiesterase
MRIAIIGDYHGRDLEGLAETLEKQGVEQVISLGDYDQPHVVRYIENVLMKKFDVIEVPGNHDDAVVQRKKIRSGTLRKQAKKFEFTSEEVKKVNRMEKLRRVTPEFLDDLVFNHLCDKFEEPKYNKQYKHLRELTKQKNRSIGLRLGKEFNAYICHGSPIGIGVPDGEDPLLWARLTVPKEELDKMSKNEQKLLSANIWYVRQETLKGLNANGYNIMIRGHDHVPGYTEYNSKKKQIKSKYEKFSLKVFPLDLKPDSMYIINPGAAFDGKYAILDTDKKKVYFKSF